MMLGMGNVRNGKKPISDIVVFSIIIIIIMTDMNLRPPFIYRYILSINYQLHLTLSQHDHKMKVYYYIDCR